MGQKHGRKCKKIIPSGKTGSLLCKKEMVKNHIEIYEKSFEGQEQSREKGYEQVTPTIFCTDGAVDAKDSFTFEHSENVSGMR